MGNEESQEKIKPTQEPEPATPPVRRTSLDEDEEGESSDENENNIANNMAATQNIENDPS